MRDINQFNEYLVKFEQWLKEVKRQKSSTIRSRLSNIKTVGEYYDILKEFSGDKCQGLLEDLKFSREDVEPKTTIVINGDYYNGLATYRQTVNLFVSFLKEIKYPHSLPQ